RLVPGRELSLQCCDRCLDLLDLICQHLQYLPRHSRQALIAIIADNGDQLAHIAQALRRHHSELRQMCPQRIHQHRALAHQLLATTMQQLTCLLLSRLNRHKPHGRSPNGFTNRFGVGGVVLVALDVRLHVLRRHQPHLVPKRAELASPVMRRRTRFQPDHTAWTARADRTDGLVSISSYGAKPFFVAFRVTELRNGAASNASTGYKLDSLAPSPTLAR